MSGSSGEKIRLSQSLATQFLVIGENTKASLDLRPWASPGDRPRGGGWRGYKEKPSGESWRDWSS